MDSPSPSAGKGVGVVKVVGVYKNIEKLCFGDKPIDSEWVQDELVYLSGFFDELATALGVDEWYLGYDDDLKNITKFMKQSGVLKKEFRILSDEEYKASLPVLKRYRKYTSRIALIPTYEVVDVYEGETLEGEASEALVEACRSKGMCSSFLKKGAWYPIDKTHTKSWAKQKGYKYRDVSIHSHDYNGSYRNVEGWSNPNRVDDRLLSASDPKSKKATKKKGKVSILDTTIDNVSYALKNVAYIDRPLTLSAKHEYGSISLSISDKNIELRLTPEFGSPGIETDKDAAERANRILDTILRLSGYERQASLIDWDLPVSRPAARVDGKAVLLGWIVEGATPGSEAWYRMNDIWEDASPPEHPWLGDLLLGDEETRIEVLPRGEAMICISRSIWQREG